MLNVQKHQPILLNILRELISDNELAGQIVFKGGTCLMLFYGLDRFSTDLDFDLRAGITQIERQRVTKIISKYLALDMDYNKHFTYYWSGSYESGLQHIKVEINKRVWPQAIVNKDFYGLTVPTLAPEKMLAHKLVAITDRKTLQNRDLYDAHYMLTQGFDIDETIVQERTGQSVLAYLKQLLKLLSNEQITRNILFGLGEVLSEERKVWVKQNLVRELTAQINIYLSARCVQK